MALKGNSEFPPKPEPPSEDSSFSSIRTKQLRQSSTTQNIPSTQLPAPEMTKDLVLVHTIRESLSTKSRQRFFRLTQDFLTRLNSGSGRTATAQFITKYSPSVPYSKSPHDSSVVLSPIFGPSSLLVKITMSMPTIFVSIVGPDWSGSNQC